MRPAILQAAAQAMGAEVRLISQPWRFAGSLDPLIWRALCEENGFADADAREESFRLGYCERLAIHLSRPGAARLLPGVPDLLSTLEQDPRVVLGLLTGNFPEVARLKLRAAGLDPERFPVGAFGTDGATRRDLPVAALRKYVERAGAALPPGSVVIVGDTPRDVDCARANGCRSLAVATGSSSLADLAAAGADLAVPDLRDTQSLAAWLLR